MMAAVLAAASFTFTPPAAADWLERYENAMFVDASAMQVSEADGVELRGARLGIGGRSLGPIYFQGYLGSAEGSGRRFSELGYQMGFVILATRPIDGGIYVNCALQGCTGCPDGGTSIDGVLGAHVGIWLTKRVQLVGFYETEDLYEPARSKMGATLRFSWKMKR
jgi:hypothetical protein